MDDADYHRKYTERYVLLAYLEKMRDAVVRTSEGLNDAQVRRPGVPSGTNVLGIVHHLTGVEEHWFQLVFLGERVSSDKAMSAPTNLTHEQVITGYRKACARSNEIVEACPDLATRAAIPNPGEDKRDALRVILGHMIEETARHAGHADILREQIDGTTGL